MKTFEFNEYGVCDNPETVFQSTAGGIEEIKIEVAQIDGKWVTGVLVFGMGGGCSNTGSKFEDKEAAILYAIKQV